MLSVEELGASLVKWRRHIVVAGAALTGGLLLVSGDGTGLDQMLRSGRDAIRSHPASGQIHIVEIDARSLERIHRWPWPRHFHAAAVDRLRDAGARTIAFDV